MDKRQVWNSQARTIVAAVKEYFDEEKETKCTKLPLDQSLNRTAVATGIPLRTVERIILQKLKAKENGEKITTSNKKRQKKKTIELDDMDIAVMRRIIQQFYLEREAPTLRKVRGKLKSEIMFDGCLESLQKILIANGFSFKKCKSERLLLIEKPEIVALRNSYLREVFKLRRDPSRNFVYVDESYIHTSHIRSKCWQSKEVTGSLQAVSKGTRYILLHAGMKTGFVKNAQLVFRSGLKSGDYHDDMNHVNFKKWFTEKFLPNLPPHSIIILDNAPYHNVVIQKQPTSAWLKADIQKWLTDNNILIPERPVKEELLQLAKKHKKEKIYVIDEIARTSGHQVLRLPPYHPDLNPSELIWAQAKQYISAHQTKTKATNIVELCSAAFEDIEARQAWENVCQHVIKIEEKYWENSGLMDNVVERLVISLGGEESSQEDTENSEED